MMVLIMFKGGRDVVKFVHEGHDGVKFVNEGHGGVPLLLRMSKLLI